MAKERPILFSAPMVRAILDGSKTQTRRVMTPEPRLGKPSGFDGGHLRGRDPGEQPMEWKGRRWYLRDTVPLRVICACPYGKPGDRLWVRETWQVCPLDQTIPGEFTKVSRWNSAWRAVYKATCPNELHPEHPEWGNQVWRPSIHMPRWASRITLEIVNVRVERLRTIALHPDDIRAEGIVKELDETFLEMQNKFIRLWDSINGKKPGASWESNPWVWVIEFRKIEEDA